MSRRAVTLAASRGDGAGAVGGCAGACCGPFGADVG